MVVKCDVFRENPNLSTALASTDNVICYLCDNRKKRRQSVTNCLSA